MSTVGDVVLARLRDWGVGQVFAYPGDGINGLLSAWAAADDDPQFVQSRHEEMSAFEAVGFAKFSGQVRRVRRDQRTRCASTCSTASTTPNSTTSRSWRSSGRRNAPRWAGPISRRSTCTPVQGRLQRLRPDVHRPRTDPEPARPRRPHRAHRAGADRDDLPLRRLRPRLHARRRTRSNRSRRAWASLRRRRSRTTRRSPPPRTCSTPDGRSRCSSGRAPVDVSTS